MHLFTDIAGDSPRYRCNNSGMPASAKPSITSKIAAGESAIHIAPQSRTQFRWPSLNPGQRGSGTNGEYHGIVSLGGAPASNRSRAANARSVSATSVAARSAENNPRTSRQP